MKTNRFNKRSGLLQLGLVVSLGTTLCGFEYASADIHSGKVVTSKIESLETEMVTEIIEIKKPDVPKPPAIKQSPSILPSPPSPAPGPIIISPDPVPDPGINPFSDSDLIPLPGGFGDGEIDLTDAPIGSGLLKDFPTYKKFVKIKDVEKRRKETEEELVDKVRSKAIYPEYARSLGIEGTVRVTFVVDKEGTITEVEVIKSIQPDLDAAAVAAVKKLPKMIPGKNLDKPVNVRFTLPVTFAIKQ